MLLKLIIINLCLFVLGSHQMTWAEYKRKHGLFPAGVSHSRSERNSRSLAGKDETKAEDNFNKNLEYIEAYNRNRTGSYWLGTNEFMHLSHEELKNEFQSNPINVTDSHPAPTQRNARATRMDIDYWDWREKSVINPPDFSYNCYSSYAFASVRAVEAKYYIVTGRDKLLSVQQVVDCSYNEGNRWCINGTTAAAYNYMVKYSLASYQSYPYTIGYDEIGKHRSCLISGKVTHVKIKGWARISKTEQHLIDALPGGPFTVTIDGSQKDFFFYRGGAYDNPICSQTNLNQALLVVGVWWNTHKYYIAQNSFGYTWGYWGYIRIIRWKNMCGIANDASYPYF